ncbi:MAG TPA: hypothetical protein PLJ21_00420 [Pseudobdellovibrionaceae bacterium]|nr:hypothetical protein [Pseudobdellovibrionaceae bacterium]
MTRKDRPKPSKEMQKAFDQVPKIVKRNKRVAKEKAKIRKRFQEALGHIFGNVGDDRS